MTKISFEKMRNLTSIIAFCFLLLSLSVNAGVPLAGNYTINSGTATSGTNFQSFNAFASSINTNGISANVVVTVAPGTGPYNEQVVINTVTGAGPTATVLLEGSGEKISALTTTTQRHVVRLSNVSYFTINNLQVEWNAASTGGFYGIHLLNTADHVTISNCEINMLGTTSTLYGAIVASGDPTSILATGDFHNINITGNQCTGGGYGASVFGLVSNLASNINISGNTFYDFHSNGIYLRETDGAIVSNNIFDKRTSNVTSCNAIQVAQAANINAQIFNNDISVTQINNGALSIRGIYLFNGTGHKVYNNTIHDIRLTSGNFTGIEVRTGGTAPEISFNTVAITNASSTTGDLIGIAEELSNTNAILRNNNISITQTSSGLKTGLMLGATSSLTTALNSNYNNIYVPSGNIAVKGTLTPVPYPTMLSWRNASGQDMNSKNLDPVFTSAALALPTSTFLDNSGIGVAGITTDITGATRSTPPDVGAYEFGVVAVKELNDTRSIISYPNPAGNQVSFNLKNRSGNLLAEIYAITGQKIKSIALYPHSETHVLNIAGLNPGLYTVKVSANNGIDYFNFIKE
jgi:hypothetical protein